MQTLSLRAVTLAEAYAFTLVLSILLWWSPRSRPKPPLQTDAAFPEEEFLTGHRASIFARRA